MGQTGEWVNRPKRTLEDAPWERPLLSALRPAFRGGFPYGLTLGPAAHASSRELCPERRVRPSDFVFPLRRCRGTSVERLAREAC